MRILFDQGTPVPLKQHFPDHQVQTRLRDRIGEIVAALASLEAGGYIDLPR
jgi:hypothetical protein